MSANILCVRDFQLFQTEVLIHNCQKGKKSADFLAYKTATFDTKLLHQSQRRIYNSQQ